MNPDRHLLANICERHDVELRLDGDQLLVRWTGDGPMPQGAAGFIRRFRDDIIQALQEREEALADQERRNHQEVA